ncbi:glycosyltransferase family 39 protein [Legionella waltersii]|uniref:Dolichol monophosphate mannose synthase n=1 Tax=Legionella waltersii TaxID=66969 RepID=A0A0W1A2I4_9GAMM|nr:glycosyltransferase family 39 protein [Legionella waltersii]KTD75512.1 dolichol monophosphate mannose synthase [Legionella waltersii]SNU98418.1 dolichol monophosphate mannose synthase [Legionella waltersii]
MPDGIRSIEVLESLPASKILPFHLYIVLYFLIALIIAPIHLLAFDTYYYWDWSRHLDLSYYDGSPMIAYFIKVSTWLFGDSLFALSLVGIIVVGFTCLFIFKTAQLLMSKEASYIAVLLWLFAPLITLDLLNQTTYDTPLTLFWAMTVYYVCKYIKTNRVTSLYAVGVCIGLMLLSKYTGVVLVLGIMLFLMGSPYRVLFKSIHFYLAIFIAFVLFIPVIYWNYLHDWQSFIYQLKAHQLVNSQSGIINVLKSIVSVFLPILNFMVMPLWFYFRLDKDRKSYALQFCFVVSMTYLIFFLFKSSDTAIRYYWLTQFLITSSILGGFCYQELKIKKLFHFLIIGYAVSSVGILLSNTVYFDLFHGKKMAHYRALQQFNQEHTLLPRTIITPGWFEARMLFFLKDKPEIYTIDCGSEQNQYKLWSQHLLKSIQRGEISEVLYIDAYDRSTCMKNYFKQCQPILIRAPLHAYRCSNG